MPALEFLAGSEKRFYEFIGNLSDKDKIAVLNHNDGDGVISAVIASKVLGKTDYMKIVSYQVGVIQNLASELKNNKINKIIALDLAIFDSKQDILELEKFADILIIDHHPFKEDLNSEKTVFLKAKSDYPAAYLCYCLFSKIQKIPEWLAVLGIVSDTTHKYNEKTAINVYDDFGIDSQKINLWNNAIILNLSLVYFEGREKEVYNIVSKAKSISDLNELEAYSKIIQEEINYYLSDFEKKKEENKDLILYYYTPKYSIASILSNIISVKSKDKTFVFINKFDGLLRISCRRQDRKIDCGELMRKSVEGIPDSTAGGHVPAAGARVPSQYLKQFKENLLKAYKELPVSN